MTVDQTLKLARAATALAAVLITALGLMLARRTRLALGVLAITPMTLSLDAAVGQDGPMIATTVLAVGWIDRLVDRGEDATGTGWQLMAISVLLICVSMARPPYVPLALLVLLPGASLRRGQLAAFAAIIAVVAGWSLFIAQRVTVPFPQAHPVLQVRHILDAPGAFARVILMTLAQNGATYLREFIGQLGWLDTPIPLWFVWMSGAVLLSAFAAATNGASHRCWAVVLAVVASTVLIEAVQYVTWTGVGSPTIVGVQGRYLIPLAAACTLAVPTWRRAGVLAGPAALIGLAVLATLTPLIVVRAMVVRYYIGG